MNALHSDNDKHFHGEFKVPGGKLVVAVLDVVDDTITRANINGDFFLEPDEALNDINGALVGLPKSASHSSIVKAVEAAVDDSVVMFGFDAEAVATAVRRATGFATRWQDHSWDIIVPTPVPIDTQAVLDQNPTEDVGARQTAPAMRPWKCPVSVRAVVIGSLQSFINEADADAVEVH